MAAEASTDKSVPNMQIFENEEELSVSLAKYKADLSDRFTKERGVFTVVVSGGSLIKSLRKLVESPYRDSIDWSRWHVFWVDERVVPKDHEDINYKLAYDGFLSKGALRVFAIDSHGNICARLAQQIQGKIYDSTMTECLAAEVALLLIQSRRWRTCFFAWKLWQSSFHFA